MPFIDWNGNGEIDPTDIAIGIALDEENMEPDNDEEAPQSKAERKTGHGCLTSTLAFMLGAVAVVFLAVVSAQGPV